MLKITDPFLLTIGQKIEKGLSPKDLDDDVITWSLGLKIF
jgi:hypothetical protein